MAGDRSEAAVFAIPDFWKTSKLMTDIASETSTSIFRYDLNEQRNDDSNMLALAPLDLDTEGFFKHPALEDVAEAKLPEPPGPNIEAPYSTEAPSSVESLCDIWIDAPKLHPETACFRTWKAFNSGQTVPCNPLFLSEAGSGAYDALLSWPTDCLRLENTKTPIVQTKPYFNSLLALSLGRESVFFAKNLSKNTFKSVLPQLRVSGYTQQVLEGIEREAMHCGSTYLGLAAFSQILYASSSSQCAVALASVINKTLHAVESLVTVDRRFPRSLLELQSTVKVVVGILRPLKDLTSRMPARISDEDVLTLVYQEASVLDSDDAYVWDILCETLRRVSSPWIDSIEEWLGTRHEVGLPFTKANIGESKGFVKVDVELFTDDFGREVEDVDFRLDVNKIPSFFPMDLAELIFETGRNLRFIRAFHPDHPLSQPEIILSNNPPKAEWHFGWSAILHLEKRVEQYRESMIRTVEKRRLSSVPPVSPCNSNSNGLMRNFEFDFFGLDERRIEEQLLQSIGHLNQLLPAQSESDSLSRLVRRRCFKRDYRHDIVTIGDTPHWSLIALLSFGGIASAQAQMVNRESLRLIFEKHDLQRHLNLQRDFHLLGNGIFCGRLSHALFNPELESAERRTGVAMQGGIMGLRLGGRNTWPPASSELRLALMGVLREAYGADTVKPMKVARIGSDRSVLPGDLSFAVRDLSEEAIGKCMDPDALEALDFLRLSYTTPLELACIITPLHLMHYDRIFKLLLRALRMLYVVNQLYRNTNSRTSTWFEDNANYRFVRESHHFVSSITSYFLDSGIALPWQAFNLKLDSIHIGLCTQEASARDKAAFSPNQVRDMHTLVLDRIMHALFLRKRQEPVMRLLEEIFNMILRYARLLRLQTLGKVEEVVDQFDPGIYYAELKKKLRVFITVCKGLSEKASVGNKKFMGVSIVDEFGVGDDSLVAQLLTKLDLGDYYCRH